MQEIRWHGRGGDGAFTAARMLGLAASVYGGRYGQAFPSFGPERRGAPVLSFNRVDNKPINDHSQVKECDCVIVLDETLVDAVDVTAGLKPEGVLVLNSTKPIEDWKTDKRFSGIKNIVLLDATKMALEMLGLPIVNTIMFGAAMAATDILSPDEITNAIKDQMPENLSGKNAAATMAAYNLVKESMAS